VLILLLIHSWALFIVSEKFLYKATGGSVSLGDLSVENAMIHGLPKTLDDLLNNPGENLTYQDYASDTLPPVALYKNFSTSTAACNRYFSLSDNACISESIEK
jgi:hypothetical protein